MTLFVSDLHLGRGSAAERAATERDAVALLRAYEEEIADMGGGLYLVGDVFDAYMEYRHLVPKGFARFLGLLAGWTDRGVPVTYLAGNRDPWHLDYFYRELGVRVVQEAVVEEVEGVRTYIAHGDALTDAKPLYTRLRPLLRSPLMARLYRMSLPGDAAFALARRVGRLLSSGNTVDPAVADDLRAKAGRMLAETDAALVVLGHSHRAECTPLPGGTYLNPGYWFADRTFGRLDAGGAPALYRWTAGGTAEPLARASVETVGPAVGPATPAL
jgi:UDP-2,3-diacylglucosamine hydrolase